MKWELVKLGQIADFRNGVNYTKDNFGTGIKVISVADFQDYFKPQYHSLNEINPEGVVGDSDILEHQDIIFVRSNGNRNLIGRTMIIDHPPEPISFSAFCIRLRFQEKNVVPRFFAYLFKTDMIRRTLSAIGGGANIANLNQQILKKLEVPFPPINEQKRITEILSAYDDLIDNNNRRIVLLEEAIHRLYREWFVHLRFPGHEHTPVVAGVPVGWEKRPLKDFGEAITGKTPSTKVAEYYDGEIPFIKTPDMHNQIFVLETAAKLTEMGANSQRNKFLPEKTIMVSCIGTLGVVSITSEPSQTNQQINSVILENPSHLYYCYFALKSLKSVLQALGSSGATMGNVNKTKFENMTLLRPPDSVLTNFHDYAEPSFEQILNLQRMNLKLQEARDALLPRLMNGSMAV